MKTKPNAIEDLISTAIVAGAKGIWLVRAARAAGLVWTPDGTDLSTLAITPPHGLIVLVRIPQGDGGEAGIEFRTEAAPLAALAAHRFALRSLVDGPLAGLYPIDNGLLYCAHCGAGPADPAEPIQFEHTPGCPIRCARDVLDSDQTEETS